ncbi:hypothetical protein DSCO28_67340 [Desulfosarcina ovata subsp. sediminis]|uniref:Uncharacterized protein n=1 Tax=Desulfosarcina ovata subsp. sediminis TaxID=885957 RepID=A0A5K8A1D0_9BACT|nr:hypothetical protein [Desulfosarcina ovata]BBO86168.1 hypothetical protein DSCO28_67340 [Desulfosarcina ovata subsp. sediminis]
MSIEPEFDCQELSHIIGQKAAEYSSIMYEAFPNYSFLNYDNLTASLCLGLRICFQQVRHNSGAYRLLISTSSPQDSLYHNVLGFAAKIISGFDDYNLGGWFFKKKQRILIFLPEDLVNTTDAKIHPFLPEWPSYSRKKKNKLKDGFIRVSYDDIVYFYDNDAMLIDSYLLVSDMTTFLQRYTTNIGIALLEKAKGVVALINKHEDISILENAPEFQIRSVQ